MLFRFFVPKTFDQQLTILKILIYIVSDPLILLFITK